MLAIVGACWLAYMPACMAQGMELTPAEEAQMVKEPPITAKDLDLYIETAPRFIEAANDEETLKIAGEIGWSKLRMAAIGYKIAMAYTFLTDPEIYAFLVEVELLDNDFLPSDAEIALVKARLPELETLFEEEESPETD